MGKKTRILEENQICYRSSGVVQNLWETQCLNNKNKGQKKNNNKYLVEKTLYNGSRKNIIIQNGLLRMHSAGGIYVIMISIVRKITYASKVDG